MKPREKAIELVDKFGECTVQESWQSKNYFAIECALIAVDEIIKELFYNQYWIEVKQEIQNL